MDVPGAEGERPRILYVIHHHEYSGAEILHLPLMQADADPLLACPPDSRTAELAREAGVPTVALPFRQLRHSGGALEYLRSVGRGVRAAMDLRRILVSQPSRTTVYCIALRPGMIAAVAALGLKRRVIWYVPDCLPPSGPARLLAKALARLRADAVIAISDFVFRDAGGQRSHLGRRMTIIHPGVELDRFSSTNPEPGSPLAVVLGHVSPTKRTDLAVDVAERLAEQKPGFRVQIVGRALYRDEDFAFERDLQDRVRADPRLRTRVVFGGFTGDVSGALEGAGLLLHCRDDEPFGMALLEAMAAGLPVVAPRSGGPLEIVEDGVTGLLYPPGDALAAAAAVSSLIDDPAWASRLGAAGRERVRDRFDARHQTKLLAQAIESAARVPS